MFRRSKNFKCQGIRPLTMTGGGYMCPSFVVAEDVSFTLKKYSWFHDRRAYDREVQRRAVEEKLGHQEN